MTKAIEDMDVVELGRYFGYPDCCIVNFVGRSMALNMGYLKLAELPDGFPCDGTGYAPCPECRVKTEEQLIAELTARRKCPLPFPQDNLSKVGVWVRVEDKGAVSQ